MCQSIKSEEPADHEISIQNPILEAGLEHRTNCLRYDVTPLFFFKVLNPSICDRHSWKIYYTRGWCSISDFKKRRKSLHFHWFKPDPLSHVWLYWHKTRSKLNYTKPCYLNFYFFFSIFYFVLTRQIFHCRINIHIHKFIEPVEILGCWHEKKWNRRLKFKFRLRSLKAKCPRKRHESNSWIPTPSNVDCVIEPWMAASLEPPCKTGEVRETSHVTQRNCTRGTP